MEIILHYIEAKKTKRRKSETIPKIIQIQASVWLSKWCKIRHFKILFIFNICIYSALRFLQNSTPIFFLFNSSICSQNYYPFRKYLSIQQLFIHSRFAAHLSCAWK